eukprot:COSAG02_NODE_12486_length_1538_cov_1.755386_2_plen_130_part_00
MVKNRIILAKNDSLCVVDCVAQMRRYRTPTENETFYFFLKARHAIVLITTNVVQNVVPDLGTEKQLRTDSQSFEQSTQDTRVGETELRVLCSFMHLHAWALRLVLCHSCSVGAHPPESKLVRQGTAALF